MHSWSNTSGVTDQVASLTRVLWIRKINWLYYPLLRMQLNWTINRTISPCRIKLNRIINCLGWNCYNTNTGQSTADWDLEVTCYTQVSDGIEDDDNIFKAKGGSFYTFGNRITNLQGLLSNNKAANRISESCSWVRCVKFMLERDFGIVRMFGAVRCSGLLDIQTDFGFSFDAAPTIDMVLYFRVSEMIRRSSKIRLR